MNEIKGKELIELHFPFFFSFFFPFYKKDNDETPILRIKNDLTHGDMSI